MAGFQVQDHFTFFCKDTRIGRHCNRTGCMLKTTESHYHCNYCAVFFRGLNATRMEKHICSKHETELYANKILMNAPIDPPNDSRLEASSLPNEGSDPVLELFSPPTSPLQSFVIKRQKISTPLSAKHGISRFSPVNSSQFHKLASKTDEASKEELNSKCIVEGCFGNRKLKTLARQKSRGSRSGIIDIQSTLLLITYYHLENVGDPFDRYICHDHWKKWYNYNYYLKESLGYNFDEDLGCTGIPEFDKEQSCHEEISVFSMCNDSKEGLVFKIFDFLGYYDLQRLARTSKGFTTSVLNYLKSENVWERLLKHHYWVDRKLNGKSFKESFKAINMYCSNVKGAYNCDLDPQRIIMQLSHEFSVNGSENSDLCQLLKLFGENRKPNALEVLIYFAAKNINTIFTQCLNSRKAFQGQTFSVSDFRVGTEVLSTPFILLLFDLVIASNGNLKLDRWKDKQNLFKLLAIIGIREKLIEPRAINQTQKVVSNEVSLTCSKNLMTVLNRTGLSFSYAKDIKDSKLARQLWNKVGIRAALQSTESNMHWIECDNLETMLKSTTIHNAERLTHFLTSQLEFIKGDYTILDLHKRKPSHFIDKSCFHLTDDDKAKEAFFLNKCMQKVVQLHSYLSCDELVRVLAQSAAENNENFQQLPHFGDKKPSERILDSVDVLDESTTVFLRMEKLCSSDARDVKKLLDLTSNDYGLNELCYIPSVASSPLLFASKHFNKIFQTVDPTLNIMPPQPYFVPWGFVEFTNPGSIELQNVVADPQKVLHNIIEKLKDDRKGIFHATKVLEYLAVNASSDQITGTDKIIINFILAEFFRKQGFLNRSIDLLLNSWMQIEMSETFDSDIFQWAKKESKQFLQNCLLINVSVIYLQLGREVDCIEMLNNIYPTSDLIGSYHNACVKSILSSALASQGDVTTSIQEIMSAFEIISNILPPHHSIMASFLNQMGVILTLNKEFEKALLQFKKSLQILSQTVGNESVFFVTVKINQFFCKTLFDGHINCQNLEKLINNLHALLPMSFFLRDIFTTKSIISKLEVLLASKQGKVFYDFIWNWSFVSILDQPFSWIDYPPISKSIIFGADYQVWAHIDSLIHSQPFRYSWISTPFLGSFHKLGNLHEKLCKRYNKFHLEKHAIAFLDSPSASKVQFLLSMKDFDASNQFYYHDMIAGLIELSILYANDKEVNFADIDILKVRDYCLEQSQNQPAFIVIHNYLFCEGLAVLGLLEAQKFGDFELDMLFTKLIIPLQFTTRGINYAPALCYHVRDMEHLRSHEKTAVMKLWVANKSSKPGHCRPQDQNLEAMFNNSAKNCFKLGTVENVLNKASMIQERQNCHKNLQLELGIDKSKEGYSFHPFKIDSLLRLRACWFKGLRHLIDETDKAEVISGIQSMHNPEVVINADLSNVRQVGQDCLDKFVSVKITQEAGWKLQNPKFSEVLTVARPITSRQQRAALSNAQQQVEVMTDLLLQSTGMQVTMSSTCNPLQLLKKDGYSLHFAKKADLTSWLFTNFEPAFLNHTSFLESTSSLGDVTCMIRDCMFDFRHLKIPNCSYKDMSSYIIEQSVIPHLHKFANKDRHFTLIQTFDRRADKTKGCTEITRASVPTSPLEYTGIEINNKEQIKGFSTRWMERDSGRQKILTSYVKSCQDINFLKSKRIPHNCTHVIIGGNFDLYTAYSVDHFGNIKVVNDDYRCFHAEADTVVFFATKRYLKNNTNIKEGSAIIISCPEADNVTILLLEQRLIMEVLSNHRVKLYCSVHDKLVDVASGKPTKKTKKEATVDEFKTSNSKIKMKFYIDVSKLYDLLSNSDVFPNISNPIESLGALSIFTENDKNPAIRHVTKPLALSVFSNACKNNLLPSLVDQHGKLSDSVSCRKSFYLLYACIYFHIYRVQIRKLGNITWDSVVDSGQPNLKLLRDIGYQYGKGQLEKVMPVDGALEGIFCRAIFQANEYDQAFEPIIDYLDPLEFGFEECNGGLRPKLNMDVDQNGPQITLEEVDKLLKEQNDIACGCSDFVDREAVDCHELTESQSVLFDMSYMNISADNIFNITLGQKDNLSDLDLATSNQDNNQPESCLNESLQALFTFEEWLQEKSRL